MEVAGVSENTRMARYHPTEPKQAPDPQPQATYQRRPALGRWLAVLVLLLTVTVGLKLTVFNATYTAGVVSRSTVGERVINRLNNKLSDLGVTGNPVTASVAQPYLAMGVAQLYGQSANSVDATELTSAIETQASTDGVSASTSLTKSIAQRAEKLVTKTFNTTAMQTAASQLQWARQLNFYVLVAALLLTAVTVGYALSVHHFWAGLGPGLTLGGLLAVIVGVVGWFILPVMLPNTTTTVTHLLTSIGHSGLGVLIFVGGGEIVLGLLALLGHRTFRSA
ncbi:hypothetical protein H3M12_10630 [Levilactobacillus suantsaii]|uniref:Uncharacterized protein n=1 Tax=Levilactobacillus suantsaii TaxID=2292255 RepID=A0A4Q0VJK7_9LACO|nr:hypothetical protein H3M12_10630 [Levilactobacillus suantsaii]RXI79762.1 hypothetical protein DXH47_01095 [Levilactobacillus suantsaii]